MNNDGINSPVVIGFPDVVNGDSTISSRAYRARVIGYTTTPSVFSCVCNTASITVFGSFIFVFLKRNAYLVDGLSRTYLSCKDLSRQTLDHSNYMKISCKIKQPGNYATFRPLWCTSSCRCRSPGTEPK